MSKKTPSLHFRDYLSGGVSETTSLWQTIDITSQNDVHNLQNQINHNEPTKGYLYENLSSLCTKSLGVALSRIEYPGGKCRSSFRLILKNGQSVIASRRSEIGRAILEERILHYLTKHNGPVPKILTFNGLVLLQEDVGNQRLSNALAETNESGYKILLAKALDSLLSIHSIAKNENLRRYAPIIGSDRKWLTSFIDRPFFLGNHLDMTPPVPDLDNIRELLILVDPQFIKWDARPGNAALTLQQEVIWFDWEHCGARNRLDDLVWVMCDESTPYFPNAENQLLNKYIPLFQDGLTLKHAHSYCRVFGMLHCCTRLCLILSEKKGKNWGDHKKIIEGDKVGVTLEQAQRLCLRASDWCNHEPMIRNMSPWFLAISDHLTKL